VLDDVVVGDQVAALVHDHAGADDGPLAVVAGPGDLERGDAVARPVHRLDDGRPPHVVGPCRARHQEQTSRQDQGDPRETLAHTLHPFGNPATSSVECRMQSAEWRMKKGLMPSFFILHSSFCILHSTEEVRWLSVPASRRVWLCRWEVHRVGMSGCSETTLARKGRVCVG
jgi:hypothetical protein